MPAFIRYPFFGCVILALSACGGSGSSRLLERTDASMEGDDPVSTVQEAYPSVEYLITDIPAAIDKFASDTSMDTSDEEEMENMEDMDDDGGSQTTTDTGATALTSTPAALDTLRNSIISRSNRYLSTGAVLAGTDNDFETEYPAATCNDAGATDPARCSFAVDSLREATTTFHLGSGDPEDENRVSFRNFMADRQPVMIYREALMSQVRTVPSQDAARREVYEDADGNEYLLTSENVTDMALTDETGLPTGITLDTAPDFGDLFAVYEDADGNEYLLTSENVTDMELTDETKLPTGITLETAQDFADLSKVRESQEGGREEYVGYDGMLQYSMFFVGVHRFFDEDDELQHARFEHASLGRIYDDDATVSGAQSPSVALTGEGVMVGMERRKNNLEHHLVQGDVNIMYDPLAGADDMADPVVPGMPMIDISITNVWRLVGEDDAWYADSIREAGLRWKGPHALKVTDSKFSGGDLNPATATPGKLEGSFYGTEDDPEVGGVFHHDSGTYEIIGSFGSKLDTVPDDDDSDMMNP